MQPPSAPLVAVFCLLAVAGLAGVCRAAPPDAEEVPRLRAFGPAGLDRALDAWERAGHPDDDAWHAFVDAVAGQRYGWVSRLFWHTDLDAALAAARAEDKPVVSLRLLGRLDDEYSCANSRFFRTVLYAEPGVADWLRENAILHWSSERPVPIVTIDLGDGHVLKRTLTGNSAHYVLDAAGRPIDVLPGLYGAPAFLERLQELSALIDSLAQDPEARAERLAAYHAGRLDALAEELHRWLARMRPAERVPSVEAVREAMLEQPPSGATVPAWFAGGFAVTKAFSENPLLARMSMKKTTPAPIAALPDNEEWDLIASGRRAGGLASMARELVALEFPASLRSSPEPNPSSPLPVGATESSLPVTALVSRSPFEDRVRWLAYSVALDTARNEYLLHARIHRHLSLQPQARFEELNAWVYRDVFLTPREDPWLGLVDPRVYTGLARDGIVRDEGLLDDTRQCLQIPESQEVDRASSSVGCQMQ